MKTMPKFAGANMLPVSPTLMLMLMLLLQALWLLPSAHALYFETGYDHHYTYSSESDILGLHNVTTVMKFRIRHVNASTHLLMVDSLVQHSEHGYVVDNALKWKLDHKFYFTAASDGLVTLVHYHPGERDEVLTLKKVLASTLSTKVTISPGDTYTGEEEDHAGILEHEYAADKHTDGLRITRGHKSSKEVHRAHNKTVHLDWNGTPLRVHSLDNITLRNEPGPRMQNTVEGAAEIPEEMSGEFPRIAHISRSKMNLMAKSKHNASGAHSLLDMRRETLQIREKPKPKKPLSSVVSEIQYYLGCIHAISNKYDRNRTDCVHELRGHVTSLERDDFIQFGRSALLAQCQDDDVICQDERNLFLDIVANEGSTDSQLMMLNDVLLHVNVTEDDVRRCLFHCIALKSPVVELVKYVEDLCFAEDAQPGETPALTKNRKRACLSLGAMAKSLHEQNATVSDRIVDKLEDWLQHHDEERSQKIVKPRRRREIIQHDQRARKHVDTKMVLLQSLGNAGKQRSLSHFRSYMAPNVGVTAWRRAAIHGLRHFECNESAHHLFMSAVHDDNEVVRKAAINVLKTRAQARPDLKHFTAEHENIVLSKNYSYPVAARVRRGLMDTLEKGINVHLQTPGIEWDKKVGLDAIGAAFGLHIRNILDLKLGVLDGHFQIDVYDGAYAYAYVGLINLKVDIVTAFVCFNGHIKYDLNVLKDFDINGLSDLIHIYDKIVAKIINPIIKSVRSFNDIINFFKHRTITDVINGIVTTVKNLPHMLGDVATRMEDFVKEIWSIAGSTVMQEIKVILQQLRQFVDGVKTDILKFYNDIVDAVTMALPYIGKKVVEAFKLIVESLKSMFDNPMQAITAMSRGISDIKMAVTMVVDVKNKILDACMFIKGRADAWFSTAKEIPSVLKRLGEAFKRLTHSIRDRRGIEEQMTNIYADGIGQTKDSLVGLEEDLKAKWENVLAPLRPLIDIVKPFIDEFKSIVDFVQNIKKAYQNMKEVIESSKKLIQKVFGPKFYKSFPTERRRKKGGCPEGVYPSTTEGHYDTTGVDLALGRGQSVKNPVNGILWLDTGEDRVLIQPTDPEFSALEIIIENIVVNFTIKNGAHYSAGEKIGRAGRAPKCQPNFIHVSVRLKQAKRVADLDYQYTDPGPFLDRLMPIPKWIQECNDHEFRYIGQTFDSGESADDDEPEEESSPEPRHPDKDFEGMGDMMGAASSDYRPDDPSLYDQTPFGDSLMDSLKEQTKQFADFFKTALFGGDGPKVPNILNIVDMRKKKITWILDNLKDQTLNTELQGIVGGLCNKMTAMPSGNPLTFGIPYIQNLLKMHGLPPVVGDMTKLSDKLMNVAENACPMFRGAIAVGFGHVCTVQEDCMGITCSVPLLQGGKTEHVHIGVSVKQSEGKVVVTVNGKTIQDIVADGVDVELDLKLQFFGMKLYLTANLEFHQGVLALSAEARLCAPLFKTCLPHIELFHEIKFKPLSVLGRRRRRGTAFQIRITHSGTLLMTHWCDLKYHRWVIGSPTLCAIEEALCTGLNSLEIPNFINRLGEFNSLEKKVTDILSKVRTAVVKELLEDKIDKLGNVTKEFKDKVDFCLSANIPLPPIDLLIFDVLNHFMVGPVPMSLGFGAAASLGMNVKLGLCVLSMTTQLTLTPWVGGKVWGNISVDIVFAYGGIQLTGYLLETKFPMTTELVFSKYPIDVGAKLDLVLTPIRLVLNAYAKLNLLFTQVTVFDANLWEYSAPSITWNIFTKKKRDDDKSPPEVLPATVNARRKREGPRGCIVEQLPGRPFYNPAFTLEMHAKDEVSDVKLFYAIGTHHGGTNVVDWTQMGGNSLLAPSSLPGGVPLYWTVKARNSQGLEAVQQCSLKTYDSTLPDGRAEHAYKSSCHPSKLQASVVVFEDSPLVETHYQAVGYSPGRFGSHVVDWTPFRLDRSSVRQGVSGYLKHFAIPREGKLVAWVLRSQEVRTPELCAQKCIDFGQNCVSFSYEYHSERCDLHDVVEGANAYLRISGTYSNYERLGAGYNTQLGYNNLHLTHGTMYFVNSKVTNTLGYESFLIGEGTMVDFTPPEPGVINNAVKDILRADNCTAAVTQQCIDVTWRNNHRIIIDGDGSGTVFNGHEPVFDQLYTLTNHYVTANWKGFHDDESGIWGYTWAVGRDVCGSDVITFEDPYAHLTDKKFWTDSAFHKGVHLPDGRYYVTVQALNNCELGGSLVTTVCHSTPFIVDTSPPVFNEVTDIIYDEDFDLIAIYYNAHDDLSKIAKAEFGLGKTKYDVQLRAYSLHASMERDDPFVATEDLGLEEGVPAWPRIRVTNNVDLFTAGHGDEPIYLDRSPPIPGDVYDGDWLRRDRTYQPDDDRICAQWVNFYDPESGIDRFLWGVGTKPKIDDIIPFHNLTHYDKSSCADASLQHNHTYYSTVFAYNNALNSKSVNSSSDGVLVDITPPVPGDVMDGKTGQKELAYSSETVSKHANWHGYYDPESGIAEYKVDVFINGEHKKMFEVKAATVFEDHTISMEHRDQVHFTVHGVNGATLEADAISDGFLVDHTPPIMTAIADNSHGSEYQSDNANLQLSWDFHDPESYIGEYQTTIFETKHGVKQRFWPTVGKYNKTDPLSPTNGKISVQLGGLAMRDGATYSLHVIALNGALLATSHETPGITIDTSPPRIPKIRVGLAKEEENVNDNGNVVHNDQHAIRLSWSARDSESGIKLYRVAIGTGSDPESISPFQDFDGAETTAYIQHLQFETSKPTGPTYIASIKAINGAGLESPIGVSKQIFILKANVPGVVFDGRNLYTDEMYTRDRTSIAASFFGFESDLCNIMSYEWAIGTTEYGTDVVSYTDYGVVMLNDTHGQAQDNIELFEDTTYFVTVRAVTGCHDEFILSTSDGITLDTNPPIVTYSQPPNNDTFTAIRHGVLFQDVVDTLAIASNVTDKHSVVSTSWALGSLPLLDDMHGFTSDLASLTGVFSLEPGNATFLTTDTLDKAGNREVVSSMAVMSDNTAPLIMELVCTQYLSYRKSLLNCDWATLKEYESLVEKITVSLTTNNDQIVLDSHVIPRGDTSFTHDLYRLLNTNKTVTEVYATFVITNIVGLTKTYGRGITVDISEPEFDRLNVVTSLGQTPAQGHQKCQLPRAFVELRVLGIKDDESEINTTRFAVSLGLKKYGTEFKNYVPVKQRADGTFFLDDFNLNVGTVFYATLRVYNKAGLYSDVTSESVVVSQAPYITVIDGGSKEDIDYQALPSLLQGRWEYSDLCPIREAKWTVKDITGKVVFDYMDIPSAGRKFYNDEVTLENGRKYIVTVRTVDFLNRTKIGVSDGVAVRIQPPFPGHVRDGVEEDINYQFSNTELSANWDDFGDGSGDPTQSIDHYEVSIGNDRRYEKTRSNVHYFVDVGLNTSYTFLHLNLTQKLVRYYITVRSYSKAGGYAEGYSNGIRVGYRDNISPGSVSVSRYQSKVDSIAASWTDFQSDIGIILYKVGVSSQVPDLTNDTLECGFFPQNETVYDVSDLKSVGLNEYTSVSGVTLAQGREYWVTVVAEDEAGMCTAVTSSPVLVDTTPPTTGHLRINNVNSQVISFATSSSEMQIQWENFNDPESGIQETTVSLLECSNCHPNVGSQDCMAIVENIVHNDKKTAFYDIELFPAKSYIIQLDVTNGALLHTILTSATILIDTTTPLPGEVKITTEWNKLSNFQHSTTEIHGLLALAGTHDDYVCLNQIHIFPTNPPQNWQSFSDDFTNEFKVMNRTGAYLGVGYSSDLSRMVKAGIVSETQNLKKGNYTLALRAAAGFNIITTAAFMSDPDAVPFTIDDKPEETVFDSSRFDNMTGLEASADTNYTTTVDPLVSTTKKPSGKFKPTNDSDVSNKTVLEKEAYGFGVHFLGYKINNNQDWWHVFWARNKLKSVERWFRLAADPTEATHTYSVNVKPAGATVNSAVDLTLYVDGEEVVSIAGFDFNSDMKIAYLAWNEDNYKPPLDIFHPFYADATLTKIDIPDETDKPCLHGRGSFDGESGIKEVLVGVSDSMSEVGNVVPLRPYQEFCFPCIKPCDDLCQMPCNDTRLTEGFNLLPIQVTGLDLVITDASSSCLNASYDQDCNSTAYYLNTKLINFAGKETLVYSNGIQVDVTPPECEFVNCLDPSYNEDAPTTYLGSDSTIGAYWSCKEDISSIDHYSVKIMSQDSSRTVINDTSVGLKTKVKFDVGSGKFEHTKRYTVQLTATNTAGLSMVSSCAVQVFLYPPNVDKASFQPLYSIGNVSDDVSPLWTSDQNAVGLQWSGGSNDTEFYELSIGTLSDQEDIFPAVMIGQNETGSVAIQSGKLWLDSKKTNTTMMQVRDRRNMTVEELAKVDAATERQKGFFYMEPGRCMHLALRAVGFSHLRKSIKGRTVCIKRDQDANTETATSSHQVVLSKAKTSATWERKKVDSPEVVIDAEILSGSLSVGTLTTADKTTAYGSAATGDFTSYISDPSLTTGETTRMLRNRIQKFCGVSFFMSPSPSVVVGQLAVNVTIDSTCDKDPDYQPALIYWDADTQQWTHTDEGCYGSATSFIDYDNSVYMAKVCHQAVSRKRRRRQTDVSMDIPLQYELARIARAFPNTPPTIIPDILETEEDNFKHLVVDTHDPDDDKLVFELVQSGDYATCTIGNTTGLLDCELEEDFYGLNSLTVRVTETGLPELEQPMVVEKDITLNITATPDPTLRFFVDRFGRIHRDVRPRLYQSLNVEANDTETVFAGTIILADMDGGEVFTEISNFTALGNSTFTLTKVDINDVRKVMVTRYNTVQAYNVSFDYSAALHGNMTLKFIAQTANSEYTPSVTIDVFVLENPCVYGQCDHSTLGPFACDNIDRAASFDDYMCVCTPGYHGKWCHIEINECEAEPCAALYDCKDLVNTYACNINVGKLMAILICCILACGGLAALAYWLKRRHDQQKLRQSQVSLTDDDLVTDVSDDQPLKPADTSAHVNPGFDTKPDIDLAALSNFSAMIGNKLPPHHPAFNSGTNKPSFVPGSGFNPGISKAFNPDTRKTIDPTPAKPSKPQTAKASGGKSSKPKSTKSFKLAKPAWVRENTTAFTLGTSQPKQEWPSRIVEDGPDVDPNDASITWVGQAGQGGKPERCTSAASQKTTSTIEDNQIYLHDHMGDIDV